MNLEYYGRSSDAIVAQKIPEEYGISSMNINGGRITNHGVEYSVHFTPFQRKDFAWTIGINSSKNWNKGSSVNEVSTPDLSEYLSGSSSRVLKKGYPISAIWSFSFAGLDPETGYPTFNYMDFEETDSKMDPTEYLVYSGQTDPYFTGGLNTRLRYKDVSFGADFSVLLGGKKRLPTREKEEVYLCRIRLSTWIKKLLNVGESRVMKTRPRFPRFTRAAILVIIG